MRLILLMAFIVTMVRCNSIIHLQFTRMPPFPFTMNFKTAVRPKQLEMYPTSDGESYRELRVIGYTYRLVYTVTFEINGIKTESQVLEQTFRIGDNYKPQKVTLDGHDMWISVRAICAQYYTGIMCNVFDNENHSADFFKDFVGVSCLIFAVGAIIYLIGRDRFTSVINSLLSFRTRVPADSPTVRFDNTELGDRIVQISASNVRNEPDEDSFDDHIGQSDSMEHLVPDD